MMQQMSTIKGIEVAATDRVVITQQVVFNQGDNPLHPRNVMVYDYDITWLTFEWSLGMKNRFIRH